jgi:HTH-type transcriptional regulator/antitoxin MqsA
MQETMIHPETGKALIRGVRPFTVRYKGLERTVDLPGWYPVEKDGDGILVGEDMKAADEGTHRT